MRLLSLLSLVAITASPLTAQKSRTVVVVPGQMTQVITDTIGAASRSRPISGAATESPGRMPTATGST